MLRMNNNTSKISKDAIIALNTTMDAMSDKCNALTGDLNPFASDISTIKSNLDTIQTDANKYANNLRIDVNELEKNKIELDTNMKLISYDPPINPASKTPYSTLDKSYNRSEVDKIMCQSSLIKNSIDEITTVGTEKDVHILSLVENTRDSGSHNAI